MTVFCDLSLGPWIWFRMMPICPAQSYPDPFTSTCGWRQCFVTYSHRKRGFSSLVSCFNNSMLCGSYLGCSLQSALELINIWDTFQSNVFSFIVFFLLECNLKTKGRLMNFTTYNHNDSTKTWMWSPGHRKQIVWSKPTEQKNLNWLIGSV